MNTTLPSLKMCSPLVLLATKHISKPGFDWLNEFSQTLLRDCTSLTFSRSKVLTSLNYKPQI